MNIQKLLENIGLSKTESVVYITSLELGEALPKKLAEKAGIKRPTLYEIIPKLINKGLLIETIKGKRKYLVAQDIQAYLDEKKNQLDEIQRLVPELQILLSTASVKPKIIFYEGKEGVKKIYYDHLLQKQPIRELVGIENIDPELQKYISNYYIPERSRRKISLKMLIAGVTKTDIFDVKNSYYELREVRNIVDNNFKIPLGIDIYGHNVSITLHRKHKEMIGVIIRSSEIAESLASIFDFIWETSQTSPIKGNESKGQDLPTYSLEKVFYLYQRKQSPHQIAIRYRPKCPCPKDTTGLPYRAALVSKDACYLQVCSYPPFHKKHFLLTCWDLKSEKHF